MTDDITAQDIQGNKHGQVVDSFIATKTIFCKYRVFLKPLIDYSSLPSAQF